MAAVMRNVAPPPDLDAAMREKQWLPRRYLQGALVAAAELYKILEIQERDALFDPDGVTNLFLGARYRLAMTLFMSATRGSADGYTGKHDITGIFALQAAQELKYLVDVQPAVLFWPAGRRFGKPDARQSPSYDYAARLIAEVHCHVTQFTESHSPVFDGGLTARLFVAECSEDAPADVLQLHAKVKSTLLSVGFELLDEAGGVGTNGLAFAYRGGCRSTIDQAKKAVNSVSAAAHDLISEEIDRAPLCHDGEDC